MGKRNMEVKAWEETVIIPTYEVGEPEKNPMFLEQRVYQGSSGVVYPLPVIESIADDKQDKPWQAVFLENTYLKVMILPQLGGRVQMAYDKVKQRHFIYYNEVIKPALVGLTGPWISGGIEFNWPQHHRPSTYDPVDYVIEENPDGSRTVWCSEIDRMYRTKGMAGFTLYPDKAYLEVKARLYNRTPLPQTFLWWANPAVRVNEHYRSVFPPDVHAVFDHGRRDVSAFPIAKGTYYKVDYSAGVDISRYKNIPVPTSYMAVNSQYDFLGGYEHDTQGGIIHVANRHIAPGKKQWTWGNGDFGHAWDRNLTDANGPYAELMCGVYTDNQPDFAWLMPYEEKSFSQYFMPYNELGLVKNASKNALLNMEINDNRVILQWLTTTEYPNATVQLFHHERELISECKDLQPQHAYKISFDLNERVHLHELYAVVKDAEGKILIDWRPEAPAERSVPEPAKAAKRPTEIARLEELYLTGLHLEQYRHATYRPEDYYEEALRREPEHAACNKATGLLLLRRGEFVRAARYFKRAGDTLTQRNPNPIDGEAFFYLGQTLERQGKYEEAFDAYYKATWSAYCMDTGYFHLARLAARRSSWMEALDLVDRSLQRNWNHHKARHLKVYLLRQLNRGEEAGALAGASLQLDPFNAGIRFEQYRQNKKTDRLDGLKKLLRGNIHAYLEFALDYAAFGAYAEAVRLLDIGMAEQKGPAYPMALYFKAWFTEQLGHSADRLYEAAAEADPFLCFPNRLEEMQVLEVAVDKNPSDGKAPYYLGNFYYHHRRYEEALRCWETAVAIAAGFPTLHRNLALAYYNKLGASQKALIHMEKAFQLDQSDARLLLELDQLHQKHNTDLSWRWSRLEQHAGLVEQRDDLYIERIALLNLLGKHQRAYDLISKRHFHPWEGGEGTVTGQYVTALIELGKAALREKDLVRSVECFTRALTYPPNLGEGKLFFAQDNDIYFWLGLVHAQAGDPEKAHQYWELGAQGAMEPAIPWFYNDQQPDKIFYKGLSLARLNKFEAEKAVFQQLIDFGNQHLDDTVRMDYFAVSFPEMQVWDADLNKKNKVHCLYMLGLGFLGLGDTDKAASYLDQVLMLENSHAGAVIHRRFMKQWLEVVWLPRSG